MKRLFTTTALALATGGFAFAAQAQDGNTMSASCDAPWTKVDADGNGTVSKSEAKNHLQASFSMLDADGNGNVTRQEYRDCFVRNADMSEVLKREEADFSKMDANGDDEIAMNEYRDQAKDEFDKTRDLSSDATSESYQVLSSYVWLTPEEAENPDTLKNMSADEAAGRSGYKFRALDRNDDDRLSKDEWTDTETPSGMNEEWADNRFDEIDADGSGTLSSEEFASWQPAMTDKTTTASTDNASQNETGDASASDAGNTNAQSSGDEVPVYFYFFELY